MKSLFLIVLCFFALTSSAFATSIEEEFGLAQEAYAAKNYDQAIIHFQTVVDELKKNNQNEQARQVLGNIALILYIQEKYELALEKYREALAMPGKPDAAFLLKAQRNMVACHSALGHQEEKAQQLETILGSKFKLEPFQLADFHAQLGDAYRAMELHSLAVENYTRAMKLLPKGQDPAMEGRLMVCCGLSQTNLGRFDDARANLNNAINLARELKQEKQLEAEAISNLGLLELESGNYPEALKLISEALEIEKSANLKRNLGADYNNLGLVYKGAGQYAKAVESITYALNIAREIHSSRGEAIALSNRALLHRVLGNYEEARKDYNKALELYSQDKFLEGTASCYLGLGYVYEVQDHDYTKALECYRKAYDLYERLENPGFQAEALNYIGQVLKRTANPKRGTRDLLFVDENEITLPAISEADAAVQSEEAFSKALRLGEATKRKEVVWRALQGLGSAKFDAGKLEEALVNYKKAIALVSKMRNDSDTALMGDYFLGKQSLFNEAMTVCAALYQKTKNEEYIRLQMEYDEILRNEMLKNEMNLARLNYQDPGKQELFEKLNQLSKQRKKQDEAVEAVAKNQNSSAYVSEVKELARASEDIEQLYEKLLAEWKQKYPEDSMMFETSAKVDIEQIKSILTGNQAFLQYMPLPDSLVIMCITKDRPVVFKSVEITEKDLFSLVRDDFHASQRGDKISLENYKKTIETLNKLYNLLITPVSEEIEDKDHLLIAASKSLTYVPFAALVKDFSHIEDPAYLIEEKTISSFRLSFLESALKSRKMKSLEEMSLLAVANPDNVLLNTVLSSLEGAVTEVERVTSAWKGKGMSQILTLEGGKATETAWLEKLNQARPDVFYFATHGMPFAETYSTKIKFKKMLETGLNSKGKELSSRRREILGNYLKFYDMAIKDDKSHLNTYLYLAYPDEKDGVGALTLKKLFELPEEYFSNAHLAVLSACNTGVSYSPKLKDTGVEEDLETQEAQQELIKNGWTPGVDEVCMVDSFMKRNFKHVIGTLWPASDYSFPILISRFAEQYDGANEVSAMRQAQLDYLSREPTEDTEVVEGVNLDTHPFYWACPVVFGL